MVLMTDHFRCHVSRSATSILMIVIPNNPWYPQISNSEVSVRIKNKILRFEIPVNDLPFMKVLKTDNDISYEKFSFLLRKFALAADMISEISTIKIVHHKEEIFTILKSIFHVNQKRMVKIRE